MIFFLFPFKKVCAICRELTFFFRLSWLTYAHHRPRSPRLLVLALAIVRGSSSVHLSVLLNRLSRPELCFLCFSQPDDDDDDDDGHPPRAIGAVVCKQDVHRGKLNRGYIAMLTTKKEARKRGIARTLVQMAMQRMVADGAQEIVLETEFDNAAALAFYQKLGFIREKRLFAFYLNHKDAFRLVYPISTSPEHDEEDPYS